MDVSQISEDVVRVAGSDFASFQDWVGAIDAAERAAAFGLNRNQVRLRIVEIGDGVVIDCTGQGGVGKAEHAGAKGLVSGQAVSELDNGVFAFAADAVFDAGQAEDVFGIQEKPSA